MRRGRAGISRGPSQDFRGRNPHHARGSYEYTSLAGPNEIADDGDGVLVEGVGVGEGEGVFHRHFWRWIAGPMH